MIVLKMIIRRRSGRRRQKIREEEERGEIISRKEKRIERNPAARCKRK